MIEITKIIKERDIEEELKKILKPYAHQSNFEKYIKIQKGLIKLNTKECIKHKWARIGTITYCLVCGGIKKED